MWCTDEAEEPVRVMIAYNSLDALGVIVDRGRVSGVRT